ncbi:class I SAM-dependent methyltransferase [Saccharopolyspora sp. 5N708]|uniref:class I SAM-dependent methyltransferase n=1 Tax=Saccharopolyspora sp. 5N708 TaxID=3457424 RepID=UPI003FD0A6A1
MGVTLPTFTPAQQSLFLTLGGRALDSRLPRPFLGDTTADEIVRKIGYDLAKFPLPKSKLFDIAMRAKKLDEVVQQFVIRHPDAIVLDLGAGLDSRVFRVDPPATVDWYDVDFPEVVAVRRQVLAQRANARGIGVDLTDAQWLDDVPADRPAVIVADGLVPFLTQDGFVSLLKRLTSHFPSGELAFNGYPKLAVWVVKHYPRAFGGIADGVVNPGFDDPRDPERWVAGLKLVEETFPAQGPEAAELPLGIRLVGSLVSILSARSPALSRRISTTVLRYSF